MITKTPHTCNDGQGPHFGKKTPGCPRCDELSTGAAPRSGWGMSAADRVREIRFLHRQMDCKGEPHVRSINPGGYCNGCGAGRDFS